MRLTPGDGNKDIVSWDDPGEWVMDATELAHAIVRQSEYQSEHQHQSGRQDGIPLR